MSENQSLENTKPLAPYTVKKMPTHDDLVESGVITEPMSSGEDYAQWQVCHCTSCTMLRKDLEMKEDQARPALEKGDFLVPGVSLDMTGMEVRISNDPITKAQLANDPFGAKEVINAAYDLALASGTHPVQCIKAAYAAGMAHAESYQYINLSSKGSNVAEYRMVQKKEGGSSVK